MRKICLGVGGGVGGGGVFVPVLIMFAGFTTKEAIPLSTVMIGCASVANFFQLRLKKHPSAARPMIDYNIALLMQPTSMGGTILGVILNQVLPEWVLLVLLICLIATTIYRSSKKGLSMYSQETAKLNAAAPSSPPASPPSPPPASPPLSPDGEVELDTIEKEPEKPDPPAPAQAVEPTIEWMPWNVLGALVGILALVCLHSFIVGGKSSKISPIGIQRCSGLYWALFITIFPILGYIAYWAVQRAARIYEEYVASGAQPVEGDVSWTLQRAGLVSGGSVLAGIMSSSLGIGGGMVLGPIMLELGMLPDVTAATSSFMILFTAWSGVFQYLVAKRVRLDYAIFFGLCGIVSSVLGQTALDYMVKKHGRKSIIVFTAIFIISLSAILLTYTSGRSIYWNIQAGADMGFRSYC
eukprot:TRINITY_DN1610_c0_g1_i2.p1 TRINITY_DN1610_c0_g1~~TRINITY_DN1610_c0_g1_i2.p1  ORF type:complete len:411 (-),score=49.86 TRINITY_DN1610_c0_g1_i2:435-1667(-)